MTHEILILNVLVTTYGKLDFVGGFTISGLSHAVVASVSVTSASEKSGQHHLQILFCKPSQVPHIK